MTDRDTYHHGNLKQALIDAGLEILETKGLSALSLRACAERAGVSHTAPKNHFGNVTGLLTAIAAQGFLRLNDAIILHTDAQCSERQKTALTGYVSFARENPALFELMFSPGKVDFHDPAIAGPLAQCAMVLRDVSRGQSEPGLFKPEEIRLWSLVHGFATLSAQGVFDKPGMRDIGIMDLLSDADIPDA
jgi:AcrR family transcriptional regulator